MATWWLKLLRELLGNANALIPVHWCRKTETSLEMAYAEIKAYN